MIWRVVGGVDILERVVRGGLTEKVTYEQRPGGRERTNCGHIKGRTFQAERSAVVKAPR